MATISGRDSRTRRTRRTKRTAEPSPSKRAGRNGIAPDKRANQFPVSTARFAAVMLAAEISGLLSAKTSRIGGRVSPALVKQAKRLTGIETDSDLIAFALATIALDDGFADAFKESRGKVDPDLKLGF